ncbi:hypothetical protein [Nostoc sp.]|uniref:hypothetical protein n=1 Tax=Nostoc sp. TaxID=1180 RepID=UPI002FF651D1
MKIISRYCDRCNHEILDGYHDDVSDFLKNEYPGKDICADCDLLITLSNSLTKDDLISGSKPGTALKKMLVMYGIEQI